MWADLGAGSGTFTLALASLLGPNGTVYAVDRDEGALAELTRAVARRAASLAPVHTVVADFTRSLSLPPLDGVVLANALHFVPYAEQADVLGRVARVVKPGGAVVVIEYERRRANPWVPYPISREALAALARAAGLGEAALLATRPSAYSGTIYSVRFKASEFLIPPGRPDQEL